MTRTAIYVRQSLDRTGEELAVKRQRDACQAIAAQRGWAVVETYVDNSVSASKDTVQRPAYERMAADYRAGHFDALICWDLDRLTRQPVQLESWIKAAEDRGLLLVTANGEADLSTDNGRLFARIKAAVARSEVERKSSRQKFAAAQRAEHGKPPAGAWPFGYTASGKIQEREAATVRTMFQRFTEGDSIRSLATWLNDGPHRPRRGREWHHAAVRTMLRNPRYAGITVHRGREVGPGNWPSIVTEPTLRAAQRKLADPRRRKQQGTHRRHLGSGLYLCSKCGGQMTSFSGERYRCGDGGRCLSRKRTPIDAFVLGVVRARLGRDDLADLLPVDQSAKVKRATADVERLRGRLEQTEADYDADLIDARRFKTKTEKIAAELGTAEARLGRMAGGGGLAGVVTARDPVAAFNAAPLMIQRAVIDELLDVVVLAPATRGRRTFDPRSVRIIWRGSESP